MTAFGAGFKTEVWAGYSPIEPGATWISGWRKRRLWHLLAADLDADGVEEVIRGIGGIWNDVAVHRGAEHEKCVWSRSLGPGRMTSLVAVDLTRDGKKELAVAMRSGWVCTFDHRGTPLWQEKMPGGVGAMCAVDRPARLAVGCRDGAVHLLDECGKTLRTTRLADGISVLQAHGNAVLAGTENGEVALFGTGD